MRVTITLDGPPSDVTAIVGMSSQAGILRHLHDHADDNPTPTPEPSKPTRARRGTRQPEVVVGNRIAKAWQTKDSDIRKNSPGTVRDIRGNNAGHAVLVEWDSPDYPMDWIPVSQVRKIR